MTAVLPPTPAVLRAYRASRYLAGSLEARIGHVPRGLDAGRTDWALLSAANPGGRRMPDGWNARAMQRLGTILRRVPHRPGQGRLGRWSEPLVMAALNERQARALARHFRQNAIVMLRAGRPARLVLV